MKSFQSFLIEQYSEEEVLQEGKFTDAFKSAVLGLAIGGTVGPFLTGERNPITRMFPRGETQTQISPREQQPQTNTQAETSPREEEQPQTQTNTPAETSSPEVRKPTVLKNNLDTVKRQKQARKTVIERIKDKEGFRTKAYDDRQSFTSDGEERSLNPGEEAKGTATIGYGSTFHYDENGNPIKVPHPTKKGEVINKPITGGETISKEKAHHYVVSHIRNEIHRPLASKHPTIFDFKHNHDIHPAAISAFYDLAYNNGHPALTYYGPRNGRIVGDSVAKPLISANSATDREERLHHIFEALHGTLDFHKLGTPLKPSKGLINRRWENFTHAFRSMLNDDHITQEQHDQNMERGRKRYKEILRTTGE